MSRLVLVLRLGLVLGLVLVLVFGFSFRVRFGVRFALTHSRYDTCRYFIYGTLYIVGT